MKNLKLFFKRFIIILAVFIILFSSSFTTIYASQDIIEEAITEEDTETASEETVDEEEEAVSVIYTPSSDYTYTIVEIILETKVITKIELASEEYDIDFAEEDYTFTDDTSSWIIDSGGLTATKEYTENTNDCILLTYEDGTTELINVCVSGLSTDKVYKEVETEDVTEEETTDEEVVDETSETEETSSTPSSASSSDDGIAAVSDDGGVATAAVGGTTGTNYTTITDTTLFDGDYDEVELNITSLPTIKNINDPNGRVRYYTTSLSTDRSIKATAIFFNWTSYFELDNDLSFDVYFSSCGTYNGETIDMCLSYDHICFYGTDYMLYENWSDYDISSIYLYWTAYGTYEDQTSNNEWFLCGIESYYCTVRFYIHSSGEQITINDLFLTSFSLDHKEVLGAVNETTNYIYSPSGLNYYSSFNSYSGMSYSDGYFFGSGASKSDGTTSYAAGSFLGCSFEFQNKSYIKLRQGFFTTTSSDNAPYVGYHYIFATPTAVVPDDPIKEVSSETAWVGDTITYTITQEISQATEYVDFYYTSLVFTDTLQDELEFVSLTVKNEKSKDVTSSARCTLN